MKYCSVLSASNAIFLLMLAGIGTAFPSSAKSIMVGGYVPERSNFTVTPIQGESIPGPDGSTAVAIIEIDNNLPDYQLVLQFHPLNETDGAIEDVRLESLGGMLGRGLSDPSGKSLAGESGRYIWNPGRQETATLGYKVRVMVTYKRPVAVMAPLTVTMRLPY